MFASISDVHDNDTRQERKKNCLFHLSQHLEANNQLHILDLMYGILSYAN